MHSGILPLGDAQGENAMGRCLIHFALAVRLHLLVDFRTRSNPMPDTLSGLSLALQLNRLSLLTKNKRITIACGMYWVRLSSDIAET